MGKIRGWRKVVDNGRFISWTSVRGNVVNVENPPRGWVTVISYEGHEDKTYVYAMKDSAYNHAVRFMRANPNG